MTVEIQLSEPIPFERAVERLAERAPVASAMRTREWAGVPLALRERAFFSAGVDDARLLGGMRERIGRALDLTGRDAGAAFESRAQFVAEMRAALGAAPGDSRALTDISSRRRLELIYDMNVEEAYEFGRHQAGQDPALLEAFPARELVRVEDRRDRRDWMDRWIRAGGPLPEGRMAARRDDPVWVRISRFGRPYPPFDFGSGMGVEDLDRDEAEALGLIGPGETVEASPREYNQNLEARAPEEAGELAEAITAGLGAKARVEGGRIVLREAPPESLYDRAMRGERFPATAVANVASAHAAAVSELTGRRVTGRFRHAVDANTVTHTHKSHGDPARESARGQIAITRDDFARLPRILSEVGEIRDLGDHPRGRRIASISPGGGGSYYVVEQIGGQAGQLVIVGLRRYAGKVPEEGERKRIFLQGGPG